MRPVLPSRQRLAAAGAFFTQAFVYITLTARLPTLKEQWRLDNTKLSLLLLMMVLLAGAGSVLAEQLAKRWDSAVTLRAGLVLAAVAVPVIVSAHSLPYGAVALAAYGIALGAIDASTNMQAVAIEHAYARPILPSFHGAWTLGAIAGSLLAIVIGDVAAWAPALVAVLPLLVAGAPFLTHDHGEAAGLGSVQVPWRPIVLVGVGMALFYVVDVAAQTWGTTYAHSIFGTSKGTAAVAVFAYLVASGAVRLAGDRLVGRLGVTPVLRVGALVGCAGLAGIVFAPTWPLALVGFAVAGAGLAVVAPLSFSAAARIAGADLPADERQVYVDAVIARFNLFNYAGALVGSVLTGLVGAGDLRLGFAVPMVLVLALIPLAPGFARGRI